MEVQSVSWKQLGLGKKSQGKPLWHRKSFHFSERHSSCWGNGRKVTYYYLIGFCIASCFEAAAAHSKFRWPLEPFSKFSNCFVSWVTTQCLVQVTSTWQNLEAPTMWECKAFRDVVLSIQHQQRDLMPLHLLIEKLFSLWNRGYFSGWHHTTCMCTIIKCKTNKMLDSWHSNKHSVMIPRTTSYSLNLKHVTV